MSLTPNIYLISLVFSETGRLSFANGIDAAHKEQLNIRRILHRQIPISTLFEQSFFGVISIAQLVEVTDSAVLGSVAEVVSSNLTVGHKHIFQPRALLIYYISPYQSSL